VAPSFDLQAHSTASDGELPPDEVVARARQAGIEVLALTDHDTVAGVDAALAAADRLGDIRLIPGVEISALDGAHGDLHICGYALDHHSAAFAESLEAWRTDRAARAGRMADALRAAGLELELPEREAGDEGTIGRPHLARAVLAHPANAERLAAEGLTDHAQVLEAYLIPGTPGFVPRTIPTVPEAIRAIHRAGGLAVWAHPFWDLDTEDEVEEAMERFAALGLDGVEVFYATHTEAQTRAAYAAARRLELLTTGSADFHGPEHPRFHAFGAFEPFGLEPQLGRLAGDGGLTV
jgi:hypothetical protein